ncbi:MAG: hypothetical protein ACK515_20080 [bacterium]|jgi:tripartite-type tricarboxylate transporter receptor subunit TctC|nr:hypothetical protein [Betaproteobacteria bacterium]
MKIVRLPELQARFQDADLEPVGSTPLAFAAFVCNELARYAREVKETGMEAS